MAALYHQQQQEQQGRTINTVRKDHGQKIINDRDQCERASRNLDPQSEQKAILTSNRKIECKNQNHRFNGIFSTSVCR